MTSYNTLSTDTWSLQLPEDWEQKETADLSLYYFESADGTQGLYISTWRFAPEKFGHSNSKLLEYIQTVEKKSLDGMEDCTWELMSMERSSGSGIEAVVMDYYARERSYRIACKVVASLPWAVRSTLHDYDCQDWARSHVALQEIFDSIMIRT